MAKILILEDHPVDQKIYRHLLQRQHELLFRNSPQQVNEAYETFLPDLILLDLGLVGGDGFQAYEDLFGTHTERSTPTFFVSASSSFEAKVRALSLGAVDFISKPFHPTELLLKIQNALKRTEKLRSEKNLLRNGPLTLDTEKQTLRIRRKASDETHTLTRTETKLLKFFLENTERVLSRAQILDAVWGNGVHVIDRVVDNQISALRKKSKWLLLVLKSVYGAGYKLRAFKKSVP